MAASKTTLPLETTSLTTAPGEDIKVYSRLHVARWISAVIVIALVVWIILVLADARINWAHVSLYVVVDIMVEAAWNTVVLAVISQVVAILLGLIVAVMRMSRNPVASTVAWVYTWLFRGLPVLVQILLWYNLALVIERVTVGVPFTDIVLFDESTNAIMTPFLAALLGLALNESAYMAEIIRAGLKGVDKGQTEASNALGLSPFRTLRRVILPQAMRIIVPPTGNNFINMLKTTSLASVVTYLELVRAAGNISSRNLEVMETLIAAAVWYMILVSVASVAQYFIERHFDKGFGGASRAKRSLKSNLTRAPMLRRG